MQNEGKSEEVTSFGESGNQITGALHEENLIKNGNYSVNKRLNSKGKVEVKEKGKGKKPDQQSKDNNLHNLDDRYHSDDKSIQYQQD